MLYHSSVFVGHQGVIKPYQAISDNLLYQVLTHYLHSYIKGCHICQLSCNDKPATRQLQTGINSNHIPLSKLSMDLKVMPRPNKVHKYIFCIIDGVTNYLVKVPMH